MDTPNSVSGTVAIYHYEKGDCDSKHDTVPNIVVRAFQWHTKDGVTLPITYSDNDKYRIVVWDFQGRTKENVIYSDGDKYSDDAAKVNAKYGSWKLVDETVTDSKGHYIFKGSILPGYETFIEVLSISRPSNGLPTTYIIANKEAELFNKKVHNAKNQKPFYGKENQSDVCPEGEKCIKDNDGVYRDSSPSKLTKDDRIIYAFRQKLDNTNVFPEAIPRISTWDYNNGRHNGKDNPIVNLHLTQYSCRVSTPESWYKLHTYTPIYEEKGCFWGGTSTFDILKFMNNTMLPKCKNKNSTIIDLHYYPKDCDSKLLAARASKSPAMPMPTELKQYATDHSHYYVALPPLMHLQPGFDKSYSQKLEELLLNSGLFPKGTKKDSNEKK